MFTVKKRESLQKQNQEDRAKINELEKRCTHRDKLLAEDDKEQLVNVFKQKGYSVEEAMDIANKLSDKEIPASKDEPKEQFFTKNDSENFMSKEVKK